MKSNFYDTNLTSTIKNESIRKRREKMYRNKKFGVEKKKIGESNIEEEREKEKKQSL